MKSLQFTFFSIALLFHLSLSAEITREQADATVFEYIQNEVTGDYILLRNDNPLDEDGRTSITWNNSSLHAESLNVEYPCWVYCLYNPTVTAPRTLLFLFVNKADGSLLTVKNRQDSGANPKNWTEIARTLDERELLKSKLLGEWVRSGEEDSYIYDFSDNDTIYIKTPESDTIDRWPYQTITADSIQIIRDWTTHNKVVFYSNDSIRIEDFLPGFAAVYPPHFADIVLKRRLNDEMKLTGVKWKLTSFVANGNAKTPEQDSDNRYWILFKDDNTLEGKSSTNMLRGSYEINAQTSSIQITSLGEGTYVYELPDGRLFMESLRAVRSFELQEDTLKLYYSETDYLRFNAYRDSGLPVADFNLPPGCRMNYAQVQRDSVYVINSEEEWAKIFTCESNPQIDFSTKTLLVAFGGTTNGVANISKKLLFENNTWSLTVDITLAMTAVPEGWHVVLITDKIDAQSVILNLNKHFGDGTPTCLWEQITSVAPSNNQKSRLNDVFSDSNELLRSIECDTLFVINNQGDMLKLQPYEYHDIWIDWDNYSIIGGKIVRPHGPNEIISQQLSKCFGTSSYKYEIEVKECTLCYDAEEYLYFWAIYAPKSDFKDVLLTIKTIK
jgi:hypothetical protein